MEFELKSFETFETFYNRVQLQKEALQTLILTNGEKMEALAREYNHKLMNGEKLDSTSKSMKTIKIDTAHAKDELDSLNSQEGLLTDYAKAVYDEIRLKEQEARKEIQSLYEACQDAISKAAATIGELKAEAENVGLNFAVMRSEQFAPVVRHLPIADDLKQQLRWGGDNPMVSFGAWPSV